MTIKPKLTALATATVLMASAATANADHNYGQSRNDRAQYDYAKVLTAQPIIRYVTVTTPVRECWQETRYYADNRYNRRHGSSGGTLIGAVIGGVIGHQVGSGRGNDAATIAGALIGAAVGSEGARKKGQYADERQSRQVERCATTYREEQEERIDGYRVTYRYHGQKYQTEMPYDPGQRIRVRVDVRPTR